MFRASELNLRNDRVQSVFRVLFGAMTGLLIVLVLMHSGRDTGFTGFGFTPNQSNQEKTNGNNVNIITITIVLRFSYSCPSCLWPGESPPSGGERSPEAEVREAGAEE